MLNQLQIKLELNDQLFQSYYSTSGYNGQHQLDCIQGIEHGGFDIRQLVKQQLEMEMEMK